MNNEREVLERAEAKFGSHLQSIVAIEELSELQKEICKMLRGIGNRDNVIEEMADTYIVMEECKIRYNITDKEVDTIRRKKVRRLEQRMGVIK